MSIFNKNINFEELIQFGKNGLIVANAQQVREAVIKMYRNIYGSDIDLSDASADGQFVTEIAFIIAKMLQALTYLNINLKPSSASGQFLDTICSFNNIKRKSESSSTAKLIVKNTSDVDPFAGSSSTTHRLIFYDNNGHTWIWEEVPYQVGHELIYDHTFEKDTENLIEVICEDTGPVNAYKNDNILTNNAFNLTNSTRGDISKCMNDNIECWQITDALLGSYNETDEELRDRRIKESYGNGISVLEGLKSDLYSTGYIKDVLIINNNSDNNFDASDKTTIDAHDIYIILRYIPVENSDINQIVDKKEIANIIYADLTPGVRTTKFDDNDYGESANINIYSDINQTIYWKHAKPIIPEFTINFLYNKDFVPSNYEDLIYDAINNYLNDISLGDDLFIADILTAINTVDNTANGKICFMATSGTFYYNTTEDNTTKIITTYNYFTLSKSGFTFTINTTDQVTTSSLIGNGTITFKKQGDNNSNAGE